MVDGVNYCHDHMVAHRDLKLGVSNNAKHTIFAVAKALCNTTVVKGENMFLQMVLIV